MNKTDIKYRAKMLVLIVVFLLSGGGSLYMISGLFDIANISFQNESSLAANIVIVSTIISCILGTIVLLLFSLSCISNVFLEKHQQHSWFGYFSEYFYNIMKKHMHMVDLNYLPCGNTIEDINT